MTDINDDAQSWMDSQADEIQDYEVPPMPEMAAEEDQQDIPDEERPYGDTPEVTNDDVRNVMNMREIKTPTATVIVGMMDVVLPLAITLLIKGSDKDDVRLDDSEKETLISAWADYLGDKNVQASPGVVLITAIATIYGAKVITCLDHRKVIQQEERIAELEQQLAVATEERAKAEAKLNQKTDGSKKDTV